MHAVPVAVQEHPPRQLPEKGKRCLACLGVSPCDGSSAFAWLLQDRAGEKAAPHPSGQGLLLTDLTLTLRSC